MNPDDIFKQADEYNRLKGVIEELTILLEEKKKYLQKHVPCGTTMLRSEDQLLVIHEEYKRKSFFPSRLRDQFPTIYEEFYIEMPYTRLIVKYKDP